jgi:hypothetical protein
MLGGNCADQDAVKIVDTPRTKNLFDWPAIGFFGSLLPFNPGVFQLPIVVLKQLGSALESLYPIEIRT